MVRTKTLDGPPVASSPGVGCVNFGESISSGESVKNFPMSILKILPTAAPLSSCASTASIEASSTRHPVVAPAGTDLRVRLNRALDLERSQPGDRFGVSMNAPVKEFLPQRTIIEGDVPTARESNSTRQEVMLTLQTNPVAKRQTGSILRYHRLGVTLREGRGGF
jgi:hypothetical protein